MTATSLAPALARRLCGRLFRAMVLATFVAWLPFRAEAVSVDICKEVLKQLFIPPTFSDVTSCGEYSFFQCAAFTAAGHPCCISIACLADPVCTVTEQIQ